jgi:hypothetical protein
MALADVGIDPRTFEQHFMWLPSEQKIGVGMQAVSRSV